MDLMSDSNDSKRFITDAYSSEPNPTSASTIASLNLQAHPEGGYFVETDRDPLLVPNPFKTPTDKSGAAADQDTTRNASTTIYYFITPKSPVGHFHRNKARTVHTLHQGRGRYVLIHADESPARVESFVVGHDLAKGERLQWIVEGGKYKASYLLPDKENNGRSPSERTSGLLISETVVPGFEFTDHDFLTAEALKGLVSKEVVEELGWLLNKGEREKLSQM